MEAAEQDRRRKEYAATLESDVLHLKEKLEALQARESRTSSALQSAVQETIYIYSRARCRAPCRRRAP